MEQEQNKIKYFLYARKSSESEDKQVLSIESQIDELKEIALQEHLEVIDTFTEAKSAKAPGRPIFDKMLARIHRGEARGILCWKLDRLARNPIDGGQISWMLQQSIIQHIQTYGRGYYPTDNVLMMSVEFGMANQFILDLSINTKRGLRKKLERGQLPGLAPLGYLNDKYRDKGDKGIIKDPERFSLIRKIWDLLLTGQYSVAKLYEIAINELGITNSRGNKPKISHFYDMFVNPFYYGDFRYKGVVHKGSHEPMIIKDEFDEAQYILGNASKPRAKTHNFAFTGLIRCGECGCMITAEEKFKHQKNGNVHHYTYYRCTKKRGACSQKPIPQQDLERQIIRELSQVEIPPEFYDWAIGVLREDAEQEGADRSIILTNQRREYDKVLSKLESLLEMRINKEINEEEFADQKTRLLNEKARLQEILNDTDSGVTKWFEKAEKAFSFARDAKARFEKAEFEKDGWQVRKGILADLGSNLSIKDGKLTVSLTKPLIPIGQAASEVQTIHKRLEPLGSVMNKRQMAVLYSQNPLLGGLRDLHP